MPDHYGELRKIFGVAFNIPESNRRRDIDFEKMYSPKRLRVLLTIKPSQLSLLGKRLIERMEYRISKEMSYYITDWYFCGLLGSSRIEMEFELSRSKKVKVKYKPKKLQYA